MNTVLIGYRGSGKSSLGKKLAEKLCAAFVDTDVVITERAGKTIKDIFAAEGEAGFRDRESAAIAEVAARDHQVIAVGGGAVLRAENVAALKRNGKIIWLQADAATLHARIAADTGTAANRPNLTGLGGGIAEVEALLAKRKPLYEAAADEELDVTRLTPEEAVERLLAMLV